MEPDFTNRDSQSLMGLPASWKLRSARRLGAVTSSTSWLKWRRPSSFFECDHANRLARFRVQQMHATGLTCCHEVAVWGQGHRVGFDVACGAPEQLPVGNVAHLDERPLLIDPHTIP